MGKALLVVVVIVLAIYSLFDVVATPRTSVRLLPKVAWIPIVLVPVLGAALWLAFGKARTRPQGPNRPARPPRRGPDDDPEFLRGL